MIKVNIRKENGVIAEIKCSGHAKYDSFGKDIVCAAFSTMIITSINAILQIDSDAISYKSDSGNLTIVNIKKDNITNKILINLENMMHELKENYNKNINIKEENHE